MSEVAGYAPAMWGLMALGAVLVGFSKTAINGTATVAVAMFASLLPARQSTGVMLVLLMAGDVIGAWTYRRDANVRLLVGLIPPVLVGVAAGVAFLAYAPAEWLRPVIGAIVVAMCLIELWRRVAAAHASSHDAGAAQGSAAVSAAGGGDPAGRGAMSGRGFGALAGFTTMVANAGGPVMTLYLLRSGGGVRSFLGTIAWFFISVNLLKLPFSVGLGLISAEHLPLIATLLPLVFAGAFLGRLVIGRLSRTAFEWTVLVASTLSGLYLLLA